MKKIVKYELEFCNTRCPNFYHKYEDNENVHCIKLNKKIFDFNITDNIWMDLTERIFPEDCPLIEIQ